METLYISLALMAISGVTYIAYRNPKLYQEQFSPKIFLGSGLAVLVLLAHESGLDAAFNAVSPFLAEGSSEDAQAAADSKNAPGIVWTGLLFAFLYGMFLDWLADHMEKEYGREAETDSDEASPR